MKNTIHHNIVKVVLKIGEYRKVTFDDGKVITFPVGGKHAVPQDVYDFMAHANMTEPEWNTFEFV